MKKILSALLAAAISLCLWGCKQAPVSPQNSTPQISTSPAPTIQHGPAQQPMFAVALPVMTQEHTAGDGTVLLRSVYQNMELTIPDPEIADKVIIDFLNRTDALTTVDDTLLTQAKDAYVPGVDFTPYLSQIIFTPTRIDQGVLSLFGEYVVYQGATHPEVNTLSVNYDMTTGKALSKNDILSEKMENQLLQVVLEALDTQKDTLYEGYERTVETLLKDNENWYLSEEGLVFYFSPYEIAPYASGVITAVVPYEKLPGVLSDAYFPGERDVAQGELSVLPFTQENMARFTQSGEVVCADADQQAILYTDGLLENIRIVLSDETTNFTVFSAAALSPGDGIIIHASQGQRFLIHYGSGEGTATKTLTFNHDGVPSLS